jgi:hypothetical protein
MAVAPRLWNSLPVEMRCLTRSLGAVAPRLWNSLPVEMCCLTDTTNFKKNLKTLHFKNIFE